MDWTAGAAGVASSGATGALSATDPKSAMTSSRPGAAAAAGAAATAAGADETDQVLRTKSWTDMKVDGYECDNCMELQFQRKSLWVLGIPRGNLRGGSKRAHVEVAVELFLRARDKDSSVRTKGFYTKYGIPSRTFQHGVRDAVDARRARKRRRSSASSMQLCECMRSGGPSTPLAVPIALPSDPSTCASMIQTAVQTPVESSVQTAVENAFTAGWEAAQKSLSDRSRDAAELTLARVAELVREVVERRAPKAPPAKKQKT